MTQLLAPLEISGAAQIYSPVPSSLINIALPIVTSPKRLDPMNRDSDLPMRHDWAFGFRNCIARVLIILAKNTLFDLILLTSTLDMLDTVEPAFSLSSVPYFIVNVYPGIHLAGGITRGILHIAETSSPWSDISSGQMMSTRYAPLLRVHSAGSSHVHTPRDRTCW
jgi:hypothetical protein